MRETGEAETSKISFVGDMREWICRAFASRLVSELMRRRNGMESCGRKSWNGQRRSGQGERLTFCGSQFLCSQTCPKRSRAVGRSRGSLAKHCVRKSANSGEQRGGMGGHRSMTMLNMADIGSSSE